MTLAETFDQLDWEAIESYVKLGQEENLHLDFKTVKNSDMTATDDKRNLARGISGFANSNGGIIVWGVDARKNADGVDCANSIAEISKPALMVSRLNTLTGDATSPIVDGIRHRAITNPETNAGVVVTLVPETDSGPYMAKLGEQRYFKRSGDSFYQMEHYDLEDMFGRRQKPKIEILFEEGKAEDRIEELVVFLFNQGRAIARHAGFLISLKNVEIIRVGHELNNISAINSGRPDASDAAEPGTRFAAFRDAAASVRIPPVLAAIEALDHGHGVGDFFAGRAIGRSRNLQRAMILAVWTGSSTRRSLQPIAPRVLPNETLPNFFRCFGPSVFPLYPSCRPDK